MTKWMGAIGLVGLLSGCSPTPVGSIESAQTAPDERPGLSLTGETLQGESLVGADGLPGAWSVQLVGVALQNGELVGTSPPVAPENMVGTTMAAQLCNGAAGCQWVILRIADALTPSQYTAQYPDPFVQEHVANGSTLFYRVQVVPPNKPPVDLCAKDFYTSKYAVAVDGTWDASGGHTSTGGSTITFGCLSGVIAKCYKWGYQPWKPSTGRQSAADVHQACTRAARADYCGDGVTHTKENTPINAYDYSWNYPNFSVVTNPVRPHKHIQGYLPEDPILHNDPNFLHVDSFEAAFGMEGALCISHARYASLPPGPLCPNNNSLLFGDPKKPHPPRLCDTYPDAWTMGWNAIPRELVPIGVDSEMYDLPTPPTGG